MKRKYERRCLACLKDPSVICFCLHTWVQGIVKKINFCQWCGGPTKHEIPDGEEKMRAICTLCGKIAYQNPKMVEMSCFCYLKIWLYYLTRAQTKWIFSVPNIFWVLLLNELEVYSSILCTLCLSLSTAYRCYSCIWQRQDWLLTSGNWYSRL